MTVHFFEKKVKKNVQRQYEGVFFKNKYTFLTTAAICRDFFKKMSDFGSKNERFFAIFYTFFEKKVKNKKHLPGTSAIQR